MITLCSALSRQRTGRWEYMEQETRFGDEAPSQSGICFGTCSVLGPLRGRARVRGGDENGGGKGKVCGWMLARKHEKRGGGENNRSTAGGFEPNRGNVILP